MPGLLDVAKARKEIDSKDLLTIERDTALTWGGRAAASYACSLEDGDDHAEAMRCFWEAETYRAEAVEHAAMAEDARFVERLTAEIESYRAKARTALLQAGHAFVAGNRTPKASRGPRPAPDSSAAPPRTPGPGRPAPETPSLGRRARPESPAH